MKNDFHVLKKALGNLELGNEIFKHVSFVRKTRGEDGGIGREEIGVGIFCDSTTGLRQITVIIKNRARASDVFTNKRCYWPIFFDFSILFSSRPGHKIARTVVQYGLDIDMEDALAVEDYILKNGEHMQVHYIDLVINEACEKIGKTPKWLEDVKRCWAESQWEEEGEDE
jgi:hypothetical protein